MSPSSLLEHPFLHAHFDLSSVGLLGVPCVQTVLIFCQVGSCAAFLILILGNVEAVLRAFGWYVSQEIIAIALLPIIILLAIPRSTTFLAGAAHFGNFTMLTAVRGWKQMQGMGCRWDSHLLLLTSRGRSMCVLSTRLARDHRLLRSDGPV